MSTKPTPDTDLDEFVGDPDATPAPKKKEIEWNGKSTKVRLCRPLNRNLQFTGPGERCMDGCDTTDHQFHIRASKDSEGKWQGPDATHFMELIASGIVANTPEAKERTERQRKRDELIGPSASPELTVEDLKRLWKFELSSDGRVNTSIERQIRRDEMVAISSGLTTAIEPLLAKIDKLIESRDEK